MEGYDPKLAQRVWQRVRPEGGQAGLEEDLITMISNAHLDAAVYLRLSRQVSQLKKLAEIKQAQAACLRGIYAVAFGKKPAGTNAQLLKDPHQFGLRRCLADEMHTLSRYERYAADPQFGGIFSELAQDQRKHCRKLAELIGR